MAKLFEDVGADGLEIVITGCPNYRPNTVISQGFVKDDPKVAFRLVRAIKKAVKIPLWVKGGHNKDTLLACEEAGADALVVRAESLRVIPLDPVTGKPLLSHPHGEGNLTGPYSKFPGMKVVADIVRQVKIPVIGNGGVFCGQDVIDYIRVGANAVELLTVIIRKGIKVIPKILSEVETYLKTYGHQSLEQIRGEALRYLKG